VGLYAQLDHPERDAYLVTMEAMAGARQTRRVVASIAAFLAEHGPVRTH